MMSRRRVTEQGSGVRLGMWPLSWSQACLPLHSDTVADDFMISRALHPERGPLHHNTLITGDNIKAQRGQQLC